MGSITGSIGIVITMWNRWLLKELKLKSVSSSEVRLVCGGNSSMLSVSYQGRGQELRPSPNDFGPTKMSTAPKLLLLALKNIVVGCYVVDSTSIQLTASTFATSNGTECGPSWTFFHLFQETLKL